MVCAISGNVLTDSKPASGLSFRWLRNLLASLGSILFKMVLGTLWPLLDSHTFVSVGAFVHNSGHLLVFLVGGQILHPLLLAVIEGTTVRGHFFGVDIMHYNPTLHVCLCCFLEQSRYCFTRFNFGNRRPWSVKSLLVMQNPEHRNNVLTPWMILQGSGTWMIVPCTCCKVCDLSCRPKLSTVFSHDLRLLTYITGQANLTLLVLKVRVW